MSDIKKVRCPHCGTVNTIDVHKELNQHEDNGFRCLLPLIERRPAESPGTISVVCTNRDCSMPFKVQL